MPKDLKLIYTNYIMSRNDELNSRAEMLEDARAEAYAKGVALGREDGFEVGREEGRAEGRAETIREMLVAGISMEVISSALGLSTEQIQHLSE